MTTPVIIGTAGAFDLAVNLTWKSFYVTGSASLKDAQSYVRGQKSNYWNVQTDTRKQVKSVGHGRFNKLEKGRRVLALAQGFCANMGEHEHCILVMDTQSEGFVWVVAVADGQVVQGTDQLIDMASVEQVVADLSDRWPKDSARVFANFEASWLKEANELTWDDLRDLALRHIAVSELLPVASATAINKNVLLVALLGVSLLAASEGWDRYKAYRAKVAAQEAAANAPRLLTPEQAWAEGLKNWQEKTRIGNPDDLSKLLTALGQAPTDIDGWEIRSANCVRQLESWTCKLGYDRRPESRATTRDLLRAMPKDWRASWGAMDKSNLSFTVQGSASRPDMAALPLSTQVSLPALSFAQHHSKAFGSIELGGAAAVPLELPKQPDGQPILVDVSQMKPVPVVLPVKAVGPLRSFALFEGMPVSWNSFSIEFGRNFSTSGEASAGFVQVFEAKGEIYAIRD